MKLVLATHNAHKVGELRRILGPQLDGIELIGYDGPEPVEDGDTFEANALIKARAASEFTGLAVLADDSGICVDALGGAPGIYSARYAGTRDDTDNYRLLLKNLGDDPNRAAKFMCACTRVSAAEEDAMPATNSSESPGRKNPTITASSTKMIASTPATPKVLISDAGLRTLSARLVTAAAYMWKPGGSRRPEGLLKSQRLGAAARVAR